MCMKIELTEQDELVIQRLMKTGAYENQAAVLNSALVALYRHHKQATLEDAIQLGLESGIDEDFDWAALKAEAKARVVK